jgi:DNA mismatch repair protein MutL
MTVRRLDDATVARIAAGEVITRPVSVVRELVDNALDAGADSVSVEVADTGLELIRVSDDGHGMTAADARLAVQRHTTSKLSGADAVDRVETLGFRGEALPSIAEVAQLELVTRREDAVEATRVSVGPGGTEVTTAGHGVGTTVTVRELFDRLPARRESLASDRREFARVSDAVSRYALAHPDVRFRLEHDGRTVLSAPGSGDVGDALLATYDRTVASQSVPVDGEHEGVRVTGAVCQPSVTRARAEHVYTAVNGRVLRDATVRDAAVAGYGDLLPGDRSPVAVLNVTLPPERVDVNVHPAKAEVRFREPETVAAAVEAAVRDALGGEDLARARAVTEDDIEALSGDGDEPFAGVEVIGQFRELYLLCESGDDLLVIDQHAAHERVTYERLRAAMAEGLEVARLDPPVTVSLSPAGAAVVDAELSAVEALGFRLEPFGDTTYRVTGVPAPLGRAAEPGAVRDVLDAFLAGDRPADPREELLAELACHPSLRAGDRLTPEEGTELLAALGSCEQPYACPHGRPTVLSVGEATLARGFDRPNTRFD